MTTSRDDFEEFVVVCSDRLLRTAYLLTRDEALAEELLDGALTRAWSGWGHLEEQPEPSVRRVVVNTYATWWHRRWGRAGGHDGGHDGGYDGGRRRRAALVLRFFDDLSVEDVADTLGCSEGTVERLTRPPPEDDLKELATRLEPARTPHARAKAVVDRVQSTGARRRGSLGLALTVAAVAAVASIVVVPPLLPEAPTSQLPPDDPMVDSPPRLGGAQMPLKVRVENVDYQFVRGQEVPQQRGRLQLAVAPADAPQVLAWSTSRGTTGEVVITVDGVIVRHALAGQLDYGVVLAAGDTHLVTVRPTTPSTAGTVGVAVYGPVRF
ncbi:MAG: sigma factor-like helix-turn-helix DNA-binding protein [Nocardioidaceae bacterium]